MKNIDLLPVSEENKKRLNVGAKLYQQHAHLIIEVVSFRDSRVIVRAEQKDNTNGKFLTKKEINGRVRDMFKECIPADWKLTVSAVDFDRKDIDSLNTEIIRRRMNHLNLRNKHISNYTGIDKCTISQIISGEKEMTKWHKAALYYLFKYHEAMQF
jgi:hypothetical protein